jgi:UDP-N-acetylglucosamine--N-acetylmuramyl-(pentapeptide) pyrophosphoryl-undecaprenol N-acetylglucosamine transferase
MRVLISGGGTGVHVFPAIAIADAIKFVHPDTEFLFVGAIGKIEMEKVPNAGYQIIGLDITGFKRRLSFDTVTTAVKAAIAMMKAFSIVRSFKPHVAIGVGGYASGPTLKVASLLGIPTVIQEQNSFAGITNKLLAKKAKRIYVAYEGMDKFFDAGKLVLTGNPVRGNILNNEISKKTAKQKLNIPSNHHVVLMMGGSLGARTINESMVKNHDLILNNEDTTFIWQVGKLYMDEFKDKSVSKLPNVKVVAFIEDMASVYSAVDIIVSRAGALSISELAIVAKPTILIPSPNVAEDHQTHNAMALVNKNAALLIKDKEAADLLIPKVFELIKNIPLRESLSKNLIQLGHPNAAVEIANDILKTLNVRL